MYYLKINLFLDKLANKINTLSMNFFSGNDKLIIMRRIESIACKFDTVCRKVAIQPQDVIIRNTIEVFSMDDKIS